MIVLFKFGNFDHLTSFREKGKLHMRTMRYFAEEEGSNPARGDRFEGTARIFRPEDVQIRLETPFGSIENDENDLATPTHFAYERVLTRTFSACLASLFQVTSL